MLVHHALSSLCPRPLRWRVIWWPARSADAGFIRSRFFLQVFAMLTLEFWFKVHLVSWAPIDGCPFDGLRYAGWTTKSSCSDLAWEFLLVVLSLHFVSALLGFWALCLSLSLILCGKWALFKLCAWCVRFAVRLYAPCYRLCVSVSFGLNLCACLCAANYHTALKACKYN